MFLNQVVAEKKVLDGWQESTTIPIWKKKSSPADCSNYRPICLLSHSMKIFERIVDERIRGVVKLSTNQCGFVPGCGTIDAIHAVRLFIEMHCEKQKLVNLAFLDMEKIFDRVPIKVIRYALRQHNIPEEIIDYWGAVTLLLSVEQSASATSMEFSISVGVHQGSALSPLLFIVVIDPISRDHQRPVSWTLLCADDVMLACEDKIELQQQVQAWCNRLERFGLKRNVKRTEYLTTDEDESNSIKVNGIELQQLGIQVSEISNRVRWRSTHLSQLTL